MSLDLSWTKMVENNLKRKEVENYRGMTGDDTRVTVSKQ
jgi:hypothetical protein